MRILVNYVGVTLLPERPDVASCIMFRRHWVRLKFRVVFFISCRKISVRPYLLPFVSFRISFFTNYRIIRRYVMLTFEWNSVKMQVKTLDMSHLCRSHFFQSVIYRRFTLRRFITPAIKNPRIHLLVLGVQKQRLSSKNLLSVQLPNSSTFKLLLDVMHLGKSR
jgi:hypothetical protein